jgi:hypothetical protein
MKNERLHNLYSSPNIIRIITSVRMRSMEHGGNGKYIQRFNRRSESMRKLGRARSRWEDNIKIATLSR